MFDENKHPRDNGGQFVSKEDLSAGELKEQLQQALPKEPVEVKASKKMTPAEKIASVHIDWEKDNILPELNEDTLARLGEKSGKSVLLKASVIRRNLGKHIDVSKETMQDIIAEALYNPIDVFPANPYNPNYYHMASFVEVKGKNGLKMGLVLLDVDKSKKNLEIGHAYFVDGEGFNNAKNKAQKKD